MSWIAFGLFIGATGKSAHIPAFRMASGCDGGTDPSLCADTRGNDGDCGGLSSGACQLHFLGGALSDGGSCSGRSIDGACWRDHRADSNRYQEGPCLFDNIAAWIHVLACGVGAFIAAIFHVSTYAFFKAQLFLGSGSVIHALHHEQDMTKMGGLKEYLPMTYMTMVAAWLAICGIIPFAGFFSKDEIPASDLAQFEGFICNRAFLSLLHSFLYDKADGADVLEEETIFRNPDMASGAPVESPPVMVDAASCPCRIVARRRMDRDSTCASAVTTILRNGYSPCSSKSVRRARFTKHPEVSRLG